MAIKGQNSCTLSTITDVKSIYTYHLLAPSTTVITNNMAPKDATTDNPGNPPGASSITITYLEHDYTWTISEPGINIQTNDIGTLYYIECTLFSNDTFDWGPIMTSSSYEAAKQAFNKATIVTNLVGDSPQHFWWLTTGHSIDIPAGAYITYVGQESFKNNPNNQPNLLLQSEGISLRNGITTKAQITSTGLEVLEGGIKGGQPNTNGYIYLSTIDYPLKDSTTTPPQAGLTINGHIPTASGTDGKTVSDPAWRAIIGTNFGVDSAGNLYASNANISGAITATSLTISDGDSTYSGISAINASGYTIEIVNDASARPSGTTLLDNQTYLYPIMRRNGEVVNYLLTSDTTPESGKSYYIRTYDSSTQTYTYTLVSNIPSSSNPKELLYYEAIDKTLYIWTYNDIQPGAHGDSHLGGTVATYNKTYRVSYTLSDDEVGQATSSQIIEVDPQKYITAIGDTGIRIHPYNSTQGQPVTSNYTIINSEGMEIVKNNIPVAQFGETIRLGSENTNNFNIKITDSTNTEDTNGNRGPGILLRRGTTVVNEIIATGMNIYGTVEPYSPSGALPTPHFGKIANFGSSTQIGADDAVHTILNQTEVGFYGSSTLFGKIGFGLATRENQTITIVQEWADKTQAIDSLEQYVTSVVNVAAINVTAKYDIYMMVQDTGESSPTLHHYIEEDSYLNSASGTYTYGGAGSQKPYCFSVDITNSATVGVSLYEITVTDNNFDESSGVSFEKFITTLTFTFDEFCLGPHYSFGLDSRAVGQHAFAMGSNTIAREDCQLAIGKFNIPINDALFVIGDGNNNNERSNLLTVSESNICIGKGVNTIYNNQFICGRYNEDKENILFAIGNGYNEDNRHNILSIQDVLGADTDQITDSFIMSLPASSMSYQYLSHHPLSIIQVLVNNVDKTQYFYTASYNDTVLLHNSTAVPLSIGDVIEVTYTVTQRYQMMNINDNTYIGSLPGSSGTFVTSDADLSLKDSWTFTIPNDIYPYSTFYVLWYSGAGGMPTYSVEVTHGTATTLSIGGFDVAYDGANTLTCVGDPQTGSKAKFKGVEYSTTQVADAQTGVWLSFSSTQDPELYGSVQALGWMNDVTGEID